MCRTPVCWVLNAGRPQLARLRAEGRARLDEQREVGLEVVERVAWYWAIAWPSACRDG